MAKTRERLLVYYDFVATPATPSTSIVPPLPVTSAGTPLSVGLELAQIKPNDRERLSATISWQTIAPAGVLAFTLGAAVATAVTVPVEVTIPITFNIFRGIPGVGKLVGSYTDYRTSTLNVAIPAATAAGVFTVTTALTSPVATTTIVGSDTGVPGPRADYFLSATAGTPVATISTAITVGAVTIALTALTGIAGLFNGVTAVYFDGEVIDDNPEGDELI